MDEEASSLGLESEEGIFLSAVKVVLRINRRGDDFSLIGVITTTAELECSRCLEAYPQKIETDFILHIRRTDGKVMSPSDDFDEDYVVVPRTMQRVDIGERVRQAVLLAFPVKPLCDPNCLGLCPHCGANRNEVHCQCQSEDSGEGWQVLRDLWQDRS